MGLFKCSVAEVGKRRDEPRQVALEDARRLGRVTIKQNEA